ETADRFATPRRTVLTEAVDAPRAGGRRSKTTDEAALQQADAPTRVLLSATGRILRVDLAEPGAAIPAPRRRSKHDAILSRVDTTVQGEFGVVTSRGRLLKLPVVALPAAPIASVLL